MSSGPRIINFTNTHYLTLFFPENDIFPNELAIKVLDYLNAIDLAKIQKTSWTWHVLIQRYFHEKIMRVKEFFLTHYIGQTFQNITNKDVFLFKELEDFFYSIPIELVSRFACLKDSLGKSPLRYASEMENVDLVRLFVESLPKEKREDHIENTGTWLYAKTKVMEGLENCFHALLPYMKSITYKAGIISKR